MDFWLNFALGVLLSTLQGLAASPHPPSFAPTVLHILTEIRDLLNKLIPPTLPAAPAPPDQPALPTAA